MQSYLFSIAGNIAAGKSTLTKALERRSGGRVVSFLERVDYVKENGYLQKYYEAVSAYDRLKGKKRIAHDLGLVLFLSLYILTQKLAGQMINTQP